VVAIQNLPEFTDSGTRACQMRAADMGILSVGAEITQPGRAAAPRLLETALADSAPKLGFGAGRPTPRARRHSQ